MVLSSVAVFFNTSMMLWLVILLSTMATKCMNALSRQRGAEGCWKTLILREVRHLSFFHSLLLFSTHSLWNSNLGMTNRVITFDLVSFELQMGNLDIWLVRIKVSGTIEKQIWGSGRYCAQAAVRDAAQKAVHITTQAKRVSHSSTHVFCVTSRSSKINLCYSSFF